VHRRHFNGAGQPGGRATQGAGQHHQARGGQAIEAADGTPLYHLCETNDDCSELGTECLAFGLCENESGQDCSENLACPGALECETDIVSFCPRWESCDAALYAEPIIEITTAVDRGDVIFDSLVFKAQDMDAMHEAGFEALTPTAPALSGALEHARQWAADHTTRRTAVVFATDGTPTLCDPLEIGDIAPIAAAAMTPPGGAPIPTYVIGILDEAGTDDVSRLEAIAEAGGTERAFLVDPTADTAGQFLAALDAIRESALTCEFILPNPETLALDRVNLSFDDGSGAVTQLVQVPSKAACADAPTTGWYYAASNDQGLPTRMEVCAEVCNQFRSSSAGRVDLQIGCQTIVR
jgi:hypothetical protein